MAAPVTAILGLGREVGSAVARRFDESGHKLMIADPDAARLEKLTAKLSEAAITHHGDLHTKLGLRNCLAATLEAFGRVDNILLIPPIPEPDKLTEMEMDRFDKSLAKTTRGAILAMRIFSEHFAEQEQDPSPTIDRVRQSGTFTFILSLSGRVSNPGQFSASVTQTALLGVMRAGAIELAHSKVRCNAITALRPRAENDEPWIKSRTPLGRAALGDEIADAALYLISPQAAIITGETLTLDGGRMALGGLLDT